MIFSFFKDRHHHSQLQQELELDLKAVPRPAKRGKTVPGFFTDMIAFVQRFCDRKIAFITRFEKIYGVRFSPGYRRRYLAKCFDSLAEDLQKIILEFLEIDFVFTLQRAAAGRSGKPEDIEAFWKDVEETLCTRTFDTLSAWYDQPLRRYLDVIDEQAKLDDKRREQLRRAHEKSYSALKERSAKLIRRFCRHKDESAAVERFRSVITERSTHLPAFLKQLTRQGFELPDDFQGILES